MKQSEKLNTDLSSFNGTTLEEIVQFIKKSAVVKFHESIDLLRRHLKRMKKLNTDLSSFNGTTLEEIVQFIKKSAVAKFDESIDLTLKLGINPKKSDECIRGSYSLIYGIKQKLKIVAFCNAENYDKFKNFGADVVGGTELIDEIKIKKIVDADVCLTTPDFFPKLVPIAKILGTSGLMPNNKEGTITNNIESIIQELKAGKIVKFRNDSAGFIHIRVGKASFKEDEIIKNIKTFSEHLKNMKSSMKHLIKFCYISSTMGIGYKVPIKYL